VGEQLADAHREVREYATGRSDFRPMFVRIDPYLQRIEYHAHLSSERCHDPADPDLSGLDPELRAMLDRLPPLGPPPADREPSASLPRGIGADLDATVGKWNEATRARLTEADGELDGVMKGIPPVKSRG
jgi:hypothetical protein